MNDADHQSDLTRREFIGATAATGAAIIGLSRAQAARAAGLEEETMKIAGAIGEPLDLSPARWIWFPSARTLPNTMMLFRRAVKLPAPPKSAVGWILADSRYLLTVNGTRVQWGPAPCDPRWPEADPIDLTEHLQSGENVIGAQVLHFGIGEGTWPAGKPGLIFKLDITHADGQNETVVSDGTWPCTVADAWQPGRPKRWYLRSLQEQFDARRYPYGWDRAEFSDVENWHTAMELDCPARNPSICSNYTDYLFETSASREHTYIQPRSIPRMAESIRPAKALEASYWLDWQCPPETYFDFVTHDPFTVDHSRCAKPAGEGAHTISFEARSDNRAASLVYSFEEQIVGWPRFTIEAPAGTIVELLVHEAHNPNGPALMNSHWHSWTRFICREGLNEFETFDFESFRWVQLHIRNAGGPVRVRDVGVRRRVFPWPNEPEMHTDEPALNALFAATINTLNNCAQETCVDGMARERQQYSGDCGHQIHAIYDAFGETRLPARFIRTYAQGLTPDGYFLDCWPAYDRLNRVMMRQIDMSYWGPILDHGVGFNFDCLHHYLYTDDTHTITTVLPALLRFAKYLESIRRPDGLLPVVDIGIPCVWIDHVGFNDPKHKQCAFNLYVAAMLQQALPKLCKAFGRAEHADWARLLGASIQQATQKHFWSDQHGLFVDNLPWLHEEGDIRLHDRTLATSVWFDQCPDGNTPATVKALAECPPHMGFSYPANAGWRLWALAKAGEAQVVLDELRNRWARLDSVRLNNTLSEDWHATPDSHSLWSHCPVAPAYVLHMSLAGIMPTGPGFTKCDIRPQLGDLKQLDLVTRTIRGPIHFSARGPLGQRRIEIEVPRGIEAELVVPEAENISLPPAAGTAPVGCKRYRLPTASRVSLPLRTA